jgi:uncharacterized protein YbaP (TraB family)
MACTPQSGLDTRARRLAPCPRLLASSRLANHFLEDKAISTGPKLWLIEGGKSRAYLFGFAQARDRSWLTPAIEAAFSESSELWLETPPPQPGAPRSPLIDELGFDRARDLFEVLGPEVGRRALALANEYGLRPERLAPLRPWLAHYSLNSAFWAEAGQRIEDMPDQVLIQMARDANKTIYSEYASQDDLLRFFAALDDDEQREHVEDLLDYLDDEKAGMNASAYDWADGRADARWIDRMRSKRPALYEVMHRRRNQDWASRIAGFLATGGTRFVAAGMNHCLGPDSIQVGLTKLGLQPRLA